MTILMLIQPLMKSLWLFFLPALACSPPGDGKGKRKNAGSDSSFEKRIMKLDTASRIAGYHALCDRIEKRRDAFASSYRKAGDEKARAEVLEEARRFLIQSMTDSAFVYWYGTPWDFNGVTQEPPKGKIACGYFVTTVLRHCGFTIDRSAMAQCASSQLIRATCEKSKTKIITNGQLGKVKTYLASQPDGIYIAGLDIHVGFIVKQGDRLDMVHSSYWPQNKVVRETMEKSEIIRANKYFMIGSLTGSDRTIRAWLEKTALE